MRHEKKLFSQKSDKQLSSALSKLNLEHVSQLYKTSSAKV